MEHAFFARDGFLAIFSTMQESTYYYLVSGEVFVTVFLARRRYTSSKLLAFRICQPCVVIRNKFLRTKFSCGRGARRQQTSHPVPRRFFFTTVISPDFAEHLHDTLTLQEKSKHGAVLWKHLSRRITRNAFNFSRAFFLSFPFHSFRPECI